MALKDVKPNSSGGKGKARFFTREECKAAAQRIRREDDKHLPVVSLRDDYDMEASGLVRACGDYAAICEGCANAVGDCYSPSAGSAG